MNRSNRFHEERTGPGVFDLYLLLLLLSNVQFDPPNRYDWSDCFNDA